MFAGMAHLALFAQSVNGPSQTFSELKSALVSARNGKEVKETTRQLDEFLTHVKIERSGSASHNEVPSLSCYYDSSPLSTSAILRQGTKNDTIQFQNGQWNITKEMMSDMEIDLLCFEQTLSGENKGVSKALGTLAKKHTYKMNEELLGKRKTLFFVKNEGLYYAAIESKKIPAFAILSNSEVLNYASCIKAILKASCIDATYDEIIGQYLKTTIDEGFVPTKGCDNIIVGRKVVTLFIPQNKITANAIAEELLRDRFLIAIDNSGNVGLLTAIALSGESDYEPTHVRLRMPMLSADNQRVQMSWRDFSKRVVALVKVDIY